MTESHHASDSMLLHNAIDEVKFMLDKLPLVLDSLQTIAEICAASLRNGGKLLFCGNGGSAAECQHLATEFVVRLSAARNRGALSAIALTTDTSLLTACSNDYGFERIFARQVEAHLRVGDILILLSTSGKSPNLIEAARTARERGGLVIAFLGESPTPLDKLANHLLRIPSPASQRVQEGHLMCGHLLVEMIENRMMRSSE